MTDTELARLAAIVSDSLAATTMGTDYAEAPEPSDEPGSPYVMRLTHEIAARFDSPSPGPMRGVVTRIGAHDLEVGQEFLILGYIVQFATLSAVYAHPNGYVSAIDSECFRLSPL